MKAIDVMSRVKWVGAIDWPLSEFHGYSTHRGSTYNAFLITGKKNILIDTVKAPFFDELKARVESVIGSFDKIDIIVSQHAEPDHSGSLARAIAEAKPDAVFASVAGATILKEHYGELPITAVKTGDTITFGDITLSFVETRMLHWPDSMFTWFAEEKVLFSQDVFGMHLATAKLWADENPRAVIEDEAASYYANIINPFSPLVAKLLASYPSFGFDPQVIAPDHGPLWRGELLALPFELYARWSAQKSAARCVVVYDTMWQHTEHFAAVLSDALAAEGVEPVVLPLGAKTRSDVAAELLNAKAIAVGSPTLNNDMLPRVADTLTYLRGLKFRGKVAAAFGSYGWSGESAAKIAAYFADSKWTLAAEPFRFKFEVTPEVLKAAENMAKAIAAAI